MKDVLVIHAGDQVPVDGIVLDVVLLIVIFFSVLAVLALMVWRSKLFERILGIHCKNCQVVFFLYLDMEKIASGHPHRLFLMVFQ